MIAGHLRLAERYARALRGRMYFELTYSAHPGSSGASDTAPYCGPIQSVHVKSADLYIVCAAGMARHWGTSLLRLKYANDASEFKSALARFEDMAAETSRRLKWNDEEQARFLARFVLLAWLIDRPFRGKGEWKRRCTVLRKQLCDAELEAASLLASRLA